MRLIECYVEGFGKLSRFSYTFSDGMNVICKENGWGKTTFAAFLKAMLYGLPSTRSKNLFENERARYAPWQGGYFGGWLTFEVGGKTYRVERGFGKKESEDTFLLLDCATNTPSKDFEGEVLGEVLFGIDLKGFERSTYISEKSEYVEADYSDVQAKLVNLQDFADVDKAIKRLNERKKFYRPTSTRGEIVDLQKEEYRLQKEIAEAEKAAKEYARLSDEITLWEDKQKQLLLENERLHSTLDQVAKERLIETYAAHQKELEQAAKEAEEKLKAAEETPLPTIEEIGEITLALRRLETPAPAPAPTPDEPVKKASKTPIFLGIFGVLLLGLTLINPWLVLAGVSVIFASVLLFIFEKNREKTAAEVTAEAPEVESQEQGILVGFLQKYPIKKEQKPTLEEVAEWVNTLMQKRDDLVALRENDRRAKEEFLKYQTAHPIPAVRQPLPSEAEETALRERFEECGLNLHQTVEHLQSLQREVAQYSTSAQGLPLLRQKLVDVSLALVSAQQNYNVIMATIEYLEQAKAELTASYLDAVQEKFAGYVAEMSKISPEIATANFKLSPSFEVTVVESGASHAESSVSRGTRDLLALCLRLALRDAIFENEEPPLLLDDPFIAFDEERIRAALTCLKDMAKTKQMIYFTCHNSRI